MRKPVHSRYCSSKAPSPQHVANRGEGTHVEVTTNKVDVVVPHISMKALEELSGCITFISHDIVDVYQAESNGG